METTNPQTTAPKVTATMNDLQLRVLQLKAHGFDIYQELNVLQERVNSLTKEQNLTIAELQKVLELVKLKQEQEDAEKGEGEQTPANPLDGAEPDADTGTILLNQDPNEALNANPAPAQPQPSTVSVKKNDPPPDSDPDSGSKDATGADETPAPKEPAKKIATKRKTTTAKNRKTPAKKTTTRKPKTAHSMGGKSK